MKHLLVLCVPLAFLTACGSTTQTGCKSTGCSAGSVCNTNTGACEVISGQGGAGGSLGGGGGSSGGGGGAQGGGGGSSADAGVDAGPVIDPFDDGGVFVAGDICSHAIPVSFDGGTVTTVSVDLAAATNQYKGSCNTTTGEGNDVIFEVTLTEPKGLIITATDTSSKSQDPVLALIRSPCPSLAQSACVDTSDSPEVMTLDRVPAGTWYVLLENYADDNTGDGTYDVQFELVDPAPGPANDSCSTAETLVFTSGSAMVTGTTTGAFNDTAVACSSSSENSPDVFYKLVLTQPQDVTVMVDAPSSSSLWPAIALSNTCGGGAANERGCDTGAPGSVTSRSVPAGTYYVVVDGDDLGTGDFTLTVTLTPPAPLPTNDTCASPATLLPNVSQMVDANAAPGDYSFSCASPSGGDVVYQFSTTAAQKVTVTVTGSLQADSVVSLRAAPCDDETNELDCKNDAVFGAEVVSVRNVPPGTYYVVVAAISPSAGQFGIELTLDPPVLPPSNDTCAAPVTLVPNVSQSIDLTAAVSDYTFACANPSGGDAVFQFTINQAQRVVVTATSTGAADAVLSLREAPCATAIDLACADNGGTTDPEVLTRNNLPAGTYSVLLGSFDTDAQFGVSLSVEAARPAPTNESCSAPAVVTLTGGTASLMVDLTDSLADIPSDLCAVSADGGDLVYQVVIPAMQTLTVVATPVGTFFDPVLFAFSPACAMATSEACIDDGGSGDAERLLVPNTTSTPKTVFVVVKAYALGAPGEVALTFTAM